jgi:hypothetical protein
MDSTPHLPNDLGDSPVAASLLSLSSIISSPIMSARSRSSSIDTSDIVTYTPTRMEMLLKGQKDRFVIVDNTNRNLSSNCWQTFGFPAIIDPNGGDPERIDKLVSCRKCFKTYSFTSNSTRFLLGHSCLSSNTTDSHVTTDLATTSPSLLQRSITDFATPKKRKVDDTTKRKIKELEARWVCQDMRPFSIVDDPGFRRLAQEMITIGMFCEFSCLIT